VGLFMPPPERVDTVPALQPTSDGLKQVTSEMNEPSKAREPVVRDYRVLRGLAFTVLVIVTILTLVQ
jgi:hypothetical protein